MGLLPIIDTIAEPITSGVNMLTQAMQNKKARKWATKESEKAYQRQQEQITQQNLYNSPLKQMERYKAANLNPNLLYGQVSNPNQQSTADYNAAAGEYDLPDIAAPNVGQALAPYSNMQVQNQQRRNMVADEKLTNSRVLESIANLPGIRAASELSISQTDFEKARMSAQRPYLYKTAGVEYQKHLADLAGRRSANVGQSLSNTEKKQYLEGGGVIKQLAGFEASNKLKQQELFNTQLDAAILGSRQDLLKQEFETRERYGGIMPTGVLSSLPIVRQAIENSGTRAVDYLKGSPRSNYGYNEAMKKWRESGYVGTMPNIKNYKTR